MRSCGNCGNFIRIKSWNFTTGLCNYSDASTITDGGHDCKNFRPKKYEREKVIIDENS